MVLSAYELEREANILRNQAVLASLGLGGGSILKPPTHRAPKPAPPKKADDVASGPSRRSNRVSKKTPLYTGLTDAFFTAEETDAAELSAVGRPRRPTTQTKRYEDEYGEDDVKRPRKKARPSVEEALVPIRPPPPLMPMSVRTAPGDGFATATGHAEKGARGWFFKCPQCNQPWSLRCDGQTLQKHYPCGSVRIF